MSQRQPPANQPLWPQPGEATCSYPAVEVLRRERLKTSAVVMIGLSLLIAAWLCGVIIWFDARIDRIEQRLEITE